MAESIPIYPVLGSKKSKTGAARLAPAVVRALRPTAPLPMCFPFSSLSIWPKPAHYPISHLRARYGRVPQCNQSPSPPPHRSVARARSLPAAARNAPSAQCTLACARPPPAAHGASTTHLSLRPATPPWIRECKAARIPTLPPAITPPRHPSPRGRRHALCPHLLPSPPHQPRADFSHLGSAILCSLGPHGKDAPLSYDCPATLDAVSHFWGAAAPRMSFDPLGGEIGAPAAAALFFYLVPHCLCMRLQVLANARRC